jgi:hypothetical protein
MRRFSISKAMLLIGLVAANFGAVRALLNPHGLEQSNIPLVLTGILPLFDALIIALYLFVRRSRIVMRRRAEAGHGIGVFSFIAFTAVTLAILVAICLVSPTTIKDAVNAYGDFLENSELIMIWALAAGYAHDGIGSSLFVFLFRPFLMAIPLSGPPLLFGLGLGWLANRYEVVITRRSEPRPDSALVAQAPSA